MLTTLLIYSLRAYFVYSIFVGFITQLNRFWQYETWEERAYFAHKAHEEIESISLDYTYVFLHILALLSWFASPQAIF